jgi:hypothetical protein
MTPQLVGSFTVDKLRCGPLAAWASAWLAGLVAFDDVVVAVSAGAPVVAAPAHSRRSSMSDLPGTSDGQGVAVGELLIAWRRSGAPVRLILPVPGDVRGCPGPASFRAAALDQGQAVVGASVGTVPLVVDHRPSSAPPTLVWRRYDVDAAAVDFFSVPDAQYELTEAIRDCATAIAREVRAGGDSRSLAELTTGAELVDDVDVSTELAAARRAGERLNLPPGFPSKAVMLIAQAERMSAVLAIADATSARPATADRTAQPLAPLIIAVRRARIAGYNALG